MRAIDDRLRHTDGTALDGFDGFDGFDGGEDVSFPDSAMMTDSVRRQACGGII